MLNARTIFSQISDLCRNVFELIPADYCSSGFSLRLWFDPRLSVLSKQNKSLHSLAFINVLLYPSRFNFQSRFLRLSFLFVYFYLFIFVFFCLTSPCGTSTIPDYTEIFTTCSYACVCVQPLMVLFFFLHSIHVPPNPVSCYFLFAVDELQTSNRCNTEQSGFQETLIRS